MIRATQFSTMWATHEIQLGTGHDHLFCARLRVVSCLWFNFKFQLIWGHSANSYFYRNSISMEISFSYDLNSIELIAANFCSSHYTRHRRGMCSVMWYSDKSKCLMECELRLKNRQWNEPLNGLSIPGYSIKLKIKLQNSSHFRIPEPFCTPFTNMD